MNRIYFDHNATAPVRAEVAEAMRPYWTGAYGNPSSVHAEGRRARAAVDLAREQVAALIGAEPEEIVFTGSGTEADNHALRGIVASHIVTSAIEHHAILETCRYLERQGCRVTYLPVDENGIVQTADDAFSSDAGLVFLMLANNDIGTIQPVREIATVARSKGILVHTDAVQALGRIPINVNDLGVDLLSISAHKIHGPKGVGALYVRHGTKIVPLIYGGSQEDRRRAGTENVPGIVGFGEACRLASAELATVPEQIRALRDRLQAGLLAIPGTSVNGHLNKRLPNTLNMTFPGVEGHLLVMALDMKGIAVSVGSACLSKNDKPSHVLLAMGRTPEQASGSIRFSLGKDNTAVEVDYVIDAVTDTIGAIK